jgi:hypothetical protein
LLDHKSAIDLRVGPGTETVFGQLGEGIVSLILVGVLEPSNGTELVGDFEQI